jgi:hypothetical protein
VPAPQDTLPTATGVGLPWDVAVVDAVAEIAAARARHGDSFIVASGGHHFLFTFSPRGVESFYALLEETASKGVADFLMLQRKLPGSLCRRDDVTSYLANLEHALQVTDTELGERGSSTPGPESRRRSGAGESRWKIATLLPVPPRCWWPRSATAGTPAPLSRSRCRR